MPLGVTNGMELWEAALIVRGRMTPEDRNPEGSPVTLTHTPQSAHDIRHKKHKGNAKDHSSPRCVTDV
jgi:hypothetical protein